MRSRFIAAGVVTALALCVSPAMAQETSAPDDGSALGACLVEHHTVDHENQFRTMLVDALTDNTAALDKSALAMGMGMILLATQQCGLKMTDLDSQNFKKAGEVYGKAIATNLLGSAMAKIGVH